MHLYSRRLILNSSKHKHVQDCTWSIRLFYRWPDRVWCVCVTWGCWLVLGVCWEAGGAQTLCWEAGGAWTPLAVPPLRGSRRVSGGSAGEGACVDSLTLPSGLASSDLCHVNCQDWEGGSRFHRGQWKRSNEFPLCFTAWQTSTYCHFA